MRCVGLPSSSTDSEPRRDPVGELAGRGGQVEEIAAGVEALAKEARDSLGPPQSIGDADDVVVRVDVESPQDHVQRVRTVHDQRHRVRRLDDPHAASDHDSRLRFVLPAASGAQRAPDAQLRRLPAPTLERPQQSVRHVEVALSGIARLLRAVLPAHPERRHHEQVAVDFPHADAVELARHQHGVLVVEVGVAAALAYEGSGILLAPVVAHAVYNGVQLALGSWVGG